MGAGSKRVSRDDIKTFFANGKAHEEGSGCSHNDSRLDREVGNCRFENTGAPYHLETCNSCKASVLFPGWA